MQDCPAVAEDPRPTPPMPDITAATASDPDAVSPAFAELASNLRYARGLIQGGRSLGRLEVRVFAVADLYRASWVQAVSALDHWVHRELYERAVAIAAREDDDRPRRFLAIKVPMSM